MRKEDLVKKLERVSLPEIEIPDHKRKLRIILLNKYFQKKRRREVFNLLRKIAPLGAMVIIFSILILNNLILPKYALAKAKKIALKDPQIQELINKGAMIKDIEITDGRAYVLVQSRGIIRETREPEADLRSEIQRIEEEFIGALAEINFKEKKIVSIQKITPEVTPLTEEEKEKAIEIANNSPETQKTLPEDVKIIETNPVPSAQMKLIRKGKSVEVVPEASAGKEVIIIYEQGKKQWESKIDLDKGTLETINYLGEISEETKK